MTDHSFLPPADSAGSIAAGDDTRDLCVQSYYALLTRGCSRRRHDQNHIHNGGDLVHHSPYCALYLDRFRAHASRIHLPDVSRLAVVMACLSLSKIHCDGSSSDALNKDEENEDSIPARFRRGWESVPLPLARRLVANYGFPAAANDPAPNVLPDPDHVLWLAAVTEGRRPLSLGILAQVLIPDHAPESPICGLDLARLARLARAWPHDAHASLWRDVVAMFALGLESPHCSPAALPVLVAFFVLAAHCPSDGTSPPASTSNDGNASTKKADPLHGSVASLAALAAAANTSAIPVDVMAGMCAELARVPASLGGALARWITHTTTTSSGSAATAAPTRVQGTTVVRAMVAGAHAVLSARYAADEAGDGDDDDLESPPPRATPAVVAAVRALGVVNTVASRYRLLEAGALAHPDVNASFRPRIEYLQWKASEPPGSSPDSGTGTGAAGVTGADSVFAGKSAVVGINGSLVLARAPYLLTPANKADILRIESLVLMRHHLQAAFFRSLFIGASPPYLELAVRRAHVVRDTATQLAAVRDARDLRRQIKAHFVGEPAVDEGGVARELMALAARGVVAPEYGLFTPCGRANEVVWFLSGLPVDREAAADYELIGKLVGLALYNGIQLPIHFPLALFKKLMGEPLLLSDLAEIDPELARGLQTLLEFPEEQVRETYCCSFTIAPPPPPGSMSGTDATAAMVELVPGGADMELKGDNRKEYVAAVLNWHLNVVVADKFSMFQRGWDAVVAESSVKHLFNGGELMQVVLGDDEFDLDALAEAAVYDGGYSPESRVVQDFWAELKALSLADQRRFLFFVTGSDRPPVGGLGRVVVVIMRQGPDSDRLPSAHTCFNVLLLPEYATREKVQVMVGRAVAHMEGFGLM